MEELGRRQSPVVQPAASATKRASIGSPSSTPSSRGKSGPRDFSSSESDIPRVPRHQKLKHLVTKLGSLVDSLSQDSASEKAEKELWKKMYRELKRKRGEDKIFELERDLHAKKLKIKKLKEKLEEKSEEVNELEDLKNLLITERLRNEEHEQARQDFNMGLSGMLSSTRVNIGIKRMGEIDEKAFKNACNSRFSSDEAEIKAVELCSLWQEKMKNPEWHPLRLVQNDNGNYLLKVDDVMLRGLEDEWGAEVYNAVTAALIDLNEYSPSGRDVIPELWNFKENKKATLKEAIHYIFTQVEKKLKQVH